LRLLWRAMAIGLRRARPPGRCRPARRRPNHVDRPPPSEPPHRPVPLAERLRRPRDLRIPQPRAFRYRLAPAHPRPAPARRQIRALGKRQSSGGGGELIDRHNEMAYTIQKELIQIGASLQEVSVERIL